MLSADALLAANPEKAVKTVVPTARMLCAGTFGEVERCKVSSALALIDANEYSSWIKVGTCIKALESCLGSVALGLWIEFSERGGGDAKIRNDQRQYAPEAVFASLKPTITPNVALGSLMSIAKDAAVDLLRTGDREQKLSALVHLRTYHRKLFEELRGAR